MRRLQLFLLGGFYARSGALTVPLPTAKKAQALFAYLALRPGQPQPRDKLATLLWGESPAVQARNSLRQAIFAIRQMLGGQLALLLDGDVVALNPQLLDVDVAAFERLVAAPTPEALAEATDHYHGDLLEGFVVREAMFETWLVVERERLRERALTAFGRLLEFQCRAGSTEAAIRTAARMLALDALQENAHRALMRLYARQGRRGAALRQYQVCVETFRRELGVAPDPETSRLYRELLASRDARADQEPARARGDVDRARGDDEGPRDAHATERPPSVATPAPPPPATAAPLIGRDRAVAATLAAVGAGDARLVLVAGEAGVGRTALVAVVGAEAARRGARVITARAHAGDRRLPLRLWIDVLRDGGFAAATVDRLVPVWRDEIVRLVPELRDAPPPAAGVDGGTRAFDAVRELVTRAAAAAPLVVVLDDVHAADDTSVELLGFLARRLRGQPVSLLATCDDGALRDAPALGGLLGELRAEGRVTDLALAPLAPAETAALAHALAEGPLAEGVGAAIWALSEGNPFVVVETVRALTAGNGGAGPALSARVREAIAMQLGRAGAVPRAVLEVAALMPAPFDLTVLARAAGLDEQAAADAVDELLERGWLRCVGETLDFGRARVRDVVYAALRAPRRQVLHRRVARVLSAASAG